MVQSRLAQNGTARIRLMSKRTRTRFKNSNPTLERRRRQERHLLALGLAKGKKMTAKRYAEVIKLSERP
jgi:hypothetical protein